jgi:fido (protein-threonine AMPylation protein)
LFDLETFATFCDKPGSPFYQAPGLTPEQTWQVQYSHMRQAVDEVLTKASPDEPLGVEHLLRWHGAIFHETFPDDAGRLRSHDEHGELEFVRFGIGVGTALTRRVKERRGAHPDRIRKQLEKGFTQFEGGVADLTARQPVAIAEAAFVAARLYGRILRIHPFVDGNLRAAFACLTAALRRLGLPPVEFSDLGAHDEVIGFALRTDGKQTYDPLARLIVEIIKSA